MRIAKNPNPENLENLLTHVMSARVTVLVARPFGTVLGAVNCAKQMASRKSLSVNGLRDAHCVKRRGRDSNPR